MLYGSVFLRSWDVSKQVEEDARQERQALEALLPALAELLAVPADHLLAKRRAAAPWSRLAARRAIARAVMRDATGASYAQLGRVFQVERSVLRRSAARGRQYSAYTSVLEQFRTLPAVAAVTM